MDRSLIQWRSSRRTGHQSINQMIDNLHEFVIGYGLKDQYYQQMIDCASVPRHQLIDYFRQGLSCIFLTTDVKPGPNPCTKPKSYGFNKGRPCVLIKINRVFGWIPEPYQSKDEVPIEIRDIWQPNMKNFVLIKCFGQYPTDQDLIYQVDHVSILGNKAIGGIPTFYFPFLNQPGYRQPYIWAQFVKVESDVLLNILCRAYAKNIRQSINMEDMTGAVHFEIFFQ
jgi:sodium/potassium-transporting ATPase subunit beta